MMIVLYVICAILALVILWFALLFVSGLFIDKNKEYNTNSRYYRFLLNFSTAIAMWLIRIRIITTGKELIPEGRFLLVSNHRSNYDPLITWHALAEYDLAFISKIENFSVPFFGKIIRKCCFMSIDRKDPEKANVTKERAAMLMKTGAVSVAVYPEGTRSKTGEMLPFHNGLFNMAKEADVPVVVMTLHGTPAIKDNFPKRSVVHLDIVETIPVEDVRALTPHDLGVRARDAMLNNLAKYEQPAAD
ncbi:MAG: 1-acyl-sn-glycerol-3-phosphate acyltransferase [Firmicutes bacterium]|nr:1-acyl-sn-glycerol-3-phosphate acyltransferase [Bacillota bacterium]